MMKTIRFLEGFLLGAALGGMLALLLTPESGEALRGRIQSETGRIQMEVKQAASDRRMEMERQLSSLRSPQKMTPA
jgi:gas vesicle protein